MFRSNNPTTHHPNLTQGIDAVTCSTVHDVSDDFAAAVDQSHRNRPDRYDGLVAFGFQAPVYPGDYQRLMTIVHERSNQLLTKMKAASNGTCEDGANGNGTPLAGPCPKDYVQHPDPHQHGNFVTVGIKNRADILKAVRRDASYLAFIGNQLGLWLSTNSNKLLAPGNKCLSREGQDLYQQVDGALSSHLMVVNESDQAPADYYNTGMLNGHPVVDEHAGIGGNLAAVSFTNKLTGNKLYVLKRCGNLALPRQTLPKGSTNNQRPPRSTPPPPPSTTPPVHTCVPPEVPSEHGICVLPKNPSDNPGSKGNFPTVGRGPNPSPPATTEPRPTVPTTSYAPPAPPTQSSPPRTTLPPPPPNPEPTQTFDPCHPVTAGCSTP